jgi:hypothetical protein
MLEDFTRAAVWGNDGANTIRLSGCLLEARGAGGDDRVKVAGAFECPPRGQRVDVSGYGGAGNDLVEAEGWNGHGSARAFGGGGVDRCRAPKELDCER